jgi:hypothetical protein
MVLETCSLADEHRQTGWSTLTSIAAEATKPRCVGVFMVVRGLLFPATHIYREDPPRVTVSSNWLDLSLSKCIRYKLVAKINGKRRSWTYEALGRILADYSRVRRASTPIASPRHAPPHPARRGKRARTYASLFLLSSTHLQVHREQSTL